MDWCTALLWLLRQMFIDLVTFNGWWFAWNLKAEAKRKWLERESCYRIASRGSVCLDKRRNLLLEDSILVGSSSTDVPICNSLEMFMLFLLPRFLIIFVCSQHIHSWLCPPECQRNKMGEKTQTCTQTQNAAYLQDFNLNWHYFQDAIGHGYRHCASWILGLAKWHSGYSSKYPSDNHRLLHLGLDLTPGGEMIIARFDEAVWNNTKKRSRPMKLCRYGSLKLGINDPIFY